MEQALAGKLWMPIFWTTSKYADKENGVVMLLQALGSIKDAPTNIISSEFSQYAGNRGLILFNRGADEMGHIINYIKGKDGYKFLDAQGGSMYNSLEEAMKGTKLPYSEYFNLIVTD